MRKYKLHMQKIAENDLFVPMLCCGTSQNTHVVISTLRFFEAPRLALNKTGSFSGVDV